MERYIKARFHEREAEAANRLANVASWYLEEHTDIPATRAIILEDIKLLAAYFKTR